MSIARQQDERGKVGDRRGIEIEEMDKRRKEDAGEMGEIDEKKKTGGREIQLVCLQERLFAVLPMCFDKSLVPVYFSFPLWVHPLETETQTKWFSDQCGVLKSVWLKYC